MYGMRVRPARQDYNSFGRVGDDAGEMGLAEIPEQAK